ncbi:MAG TPA: RsmD family RNA methyltransferase [Longimicrobiales bacterium]|nr:RsmD family RNA methyltransferase [Longimicrobiales bacterium]
MRIIGGRWAGRDLTSPGGRVRPTAEALRDRIMTLLAADVKGARVADIFAGTGALGLEALSRGARAVDFVENHPSALHALKANVAALRVRKRTRIFKRDALPFVARLPRFGYDVVLADPPYTSRQGDRVVDHWLAQPFSRVLVMEHAADHEPPRGGSTHVHEGSAFTVYRAAADADDRPASP